MLGDDAPEVLGVLGAAEELEAVLTGVPGAGQEDRVAGGRGAHRGVVAQARQDPVPAQDVGAAVAVGVPALDGPQGGRDGGAGLDDAAQDLLGARPLDGDEARAQGDLLDLALEAGAALGEGGGDALAVAGVGDDEVLLVADAVDDEVVEDPAVLGDDHGVAGPPEADLGDRADERVVERGGGARAGHLDLAHVGEVEDAGGAAHGVVLGEVGSVAQRHVPAAEVREGGAEGLVDAVEGGAARCVLNGGDRVGGGHLSSPSRWWWSLPRRPRRRSGRGRCT